MKNLRNCRWYVFVFALAVAAVGLFATSAQAVTWQITQLTDNSVDDYTLGVSGNNVLWREGWDYRLYDGSTTTHITNDGASKTFGGISGDNIAWSQGGGTAGEIFLYDGTTTTQLTSNSLRDSRPSISGNNIVWERYDGNDNEIMKFDGVTTTQLTNNTGDDKRPDVSGDNVTWLGRTDELSPYEAFLHDGLTTTMISEPEQHFHANPSYAPKISGNNVAWVEDGNGLFRFYDGSSNTTLDNVFEDDTIDYEISGENVAWRTPGAGSDNIIMFTDGNTFTDISEYSLENLSDNYMPEISGDHVVWIRKLLWEETDFEITLYDGTTTYKLTDNDTEESLPFIDGDTIAWIGHDGNDWEVFMATPVVCVIGDANCDGYVDISGDIIPSFSNFTGPGSFGMTRADGDVHGDVVGTPTTPDPADGDVDVSDLLTMFGAFTGPPSDESGLGASEAADPSIPDLVYDPATGEVVLDVDGSGIIGYVLKNGAGTFLAGNHTPILAGVTTSLAGELSEAALSSPAGANSIGFVFPTGMDLAALSSYLTTNEVSRSLGAPIVPFDLVVLGPAVPEPATYGLAMLGLGAFALYSRRRILDQLTR